MSKYREDQFAFICEKLTGDNPSTATDCRYGAQGAPGEAFSVPKQTRFVDTFESPMRSHCCAQVHIYSVSTIYVDR